uniref:Beta-lactamase domain-containing protein n=1 Tax=Parastrongyloides trichosuri TaxID=131310 RepID=A0A0N4ZTV2_PARTI
MSGRGSHIPPDRQSSGLWTKAGDGADRNLPGRLVGRLHGDIAPGSRQAYAQAASCDRAARYTPGSLPRFFPVAYGAGVCGGRSGFCIGAMLDDRKGSAQRAVDPAFFPFLAPALAVRIDPTGGC